MCSSVCAPMSTATDNQSFTVIQVSSLLVVSAIPCTHLRYPSSRSRSSWLLFNLDFAFSVFNVLPLTGCPPQAFSYLRCSSHICIQVFSYHVADHLLCQTIYVVADAFTFGKHPRSRSSHSCICVIHGYRFSPRYLVTLSLSLSASFHRAYACGPSSCCLTDLVTPRCRCSPFVASIKNPHRCHLSLLSYPLASSISSCRCSPSSSFSTSTSQITASKPCRSSAPREWVLS
jgi:hypothetical protein